MALDGKRPIAKSWQKLSRKEHLDIIERSRPNSLGLRMGPQDSGRVLVAIDVDGETGLASLKRLEAELGPLPRTLTQRTGSGGLHFILGWPAGADCPAPTNASQLAPGIDLRGAGGQIVIAPSTHANGQPYEFIVLAGIADADQPWMHRLSATHAAAATPEQPILRDAGGTDVTERARRYVSRMDPSISGSGGHLAAWRVAQALLCGFDLSRSAAMALMREFNIRCVPPWSEKDLLHKVVSADTQSKVPRGYLQTAGNDWRPEWDSQPAETRHATQDDNDDGADVERQAIQTECSTVAEAVAAVAKRPAAKPGSKAGASRPRFQLPAEAEQHPLRAPTVHVPEPECWHAGTESPENPPLPQQPRGTLPDVNVVTVAKVLLADVDNMFTGPGFVAAAGAFWVYRDGAFQRLPSFWLTAAAKQFDGLRNEEGDAFRGNPRNLHAVEALVAIDLETRQNTPAGTSFFGETLAAAAFTNGTLVFDAATRNMSLKANAPEWRATARYDFDYQPGLEPRWLLEVWRKDTFAGVEAAETELRITALRQFAGWALLGRQALTGQHRALMVKGRGGDSKSVYIDLIRHCAPPGACCSVQPRDLGSGAGGGELSRAALFEKFANLVEDVSAKAIEDTSHLKTLLAFGEVQARRIGGDAFAFRSRATQIFSANELPSVQDKTLGFARRWTVVEFPNPIDPAHYDGALLQKLLSHERREFVCWAVDGALEMLREGKPFATPECSQRLMGEWLAGGDPIASFVNGATEDAGEDKHAWTPSDSLFEQFRGWMKYVHGEQAARVTPSRITFAKRLAQMRGIQIVRFGNSRSKTQVINRRIADEE